MKRNLVCFGLWMVTGALLELAMAGTDDSNQASAVIRRLEHLNQAIEQLQKAIYPTYVTNLIKEADVLSAEAIRLAPNNAECWRWRASMLSLEKKRTEAVEAISTAVKLAPERGDYWRQKAMLLESVNMLDEALNAYTNTIRVADKTSYDYKRAFVGKAHVELRLKQYKEAAEDNIRGFGIPSRSSHTKKNLIDLSAYYNGPLTGWLPFTPAPYGCGFRGLKPGITSLGGVPFDVRGIVHLYGGRMFESTPVPNKVTDIRVDQACKRLHFLHAAQGSVEAARKSEPIGHYVLHFVDGREASLPIMYGEDVRAVSVKDDPVPTSRGAVVWTTYQDNGPPLRLFLSTWDNPHPETEIASIDYVSTLTYSAPLLVAISVE